MRRRPAALDRAKLGLIEIGSARCRTCGESICARIDISNDPCERERRLCELNVIDQALHVCETTVVLDAWARQQPLSVNAIIYGLDMDCCETWGIPGRVGVSMSGRNRERLLVAVGKLS